MTDPRDTRIAELEAEVARSTRLLELYRSVFVVDYVDPGVVQFTMDQTDLSMLFSVRDQYDAAQSPTPPAPFDDEDASLSGQPRKEEKPPAVEEPEIIRVLRRRAAYNQDLRNAAPMDGTQICWADLDLLLAFIDSRKAAVSEPCSKCSSWGDTIIAASVGWSRKNDRLEAQRDDAREERDRLRKELANRDPAQVSEWRAVAEQKQRNVEVLQIELSALKARPVVDVGKAVAGLSELSTSLHSYLKRNMSPFIEDSVAIVDKALESLQPASAKADEKCQTEEPCRFAAGDQVEGVGDNGERVTGTVKWCGRGSGACVGVETADGSEYDFNAGALKHIVPNKCASCGHEWSDDIIWCPKCKPEMRRTPMPSADPARVEEEEQERRLAKAERQIALALAEPTDGLDSLDAIADGLTQVVEYLRAEREGRKA